MKVVPSTVSRAPLPRYVVVSPVKDEERYVELTIKSVVGQTLKPVLWVVVDDGSSDRTAEIVGSCVEEHPFVCLVRNPSAGARQPGSAVIRAFHWGCASIGDVEYDFIVKLDADLSFEPDYFERLLGRMTEDESLGIVSGVYYEADGSGAWQEITMPSYHAAGACKVLRRQVFERIGGFIASPGWDTVDEIRAMTLGWKTGHFRDLPMKHHKPEGTGVGSFRTNVMHGEIYFLTGGGKLFFLLKVLHRIATRPYLLGAAALLWGYLRVAGIRKPLLVTEVEARCYRALLRDRVRAQARALLAWG